MTITDTTRSPFFTATDPAAAPAAPVAELRARVIGPVTTPADRSYAGTVSPWQLAVAVEPQIAVEAVCAQDVVETVRFARRHGLTVTPQATGHGPISALVGDILVTTRRLDECVVHPEGWARVGAGVKWLRWSRRRRHIASPRSRARSPTSASWATPPAAVSVRWPAPTAWPATVSGPSRSSPATVSCGA
jgi:FAD binding domain